MSTPKKEEPTNVHPLNRSWTLWYDGSSTNNNENWGSSFTPIITVKTAEDFLLMLKYMKPLQAMRTPCQYHFFQEGVRPMWEDEANEKGGKLWVDICQKSVLANNTQTKGSVDETPAGASNVNSNAVTEKGEIDLDTVWRNVLMALVGETLEDPGDPNLQVVGVVMARKMHRNRLALWLKNGDDASAIEKVKKKLSQEAPFYHPTVLSFVKHKELSQRRAEVK